MDVFFKCFGQIYTPSINLKHEKITELILYLWSLREERKKPNFTKILASDQYNACLTIYKNWGKLLEEAIKGMILDLANFDSHEYVLHKGKIGYKDLDTIATNIVCGYNTVFAYVNEYKKNTIDKETLDHNLAISFRCGGFSYEEVPKKYNCIMGVTGTLKMLGQAELDKIKNDYKIKNLTFIPSVFRNSILEKKKNYIENKDDFASMLKQEIQSNLLQGKSGESVRAILVFFENENILREIYKKIGNYNYKILTEQSSSVEKEVIIKAATSTGQVTFCTRIFGRGSNFICFDQIVNSNGGVHVIQTFLSEEKSEEIQIAGRTARHGHVGSYQMILMKSNLEKFLPNEYDQLEKFFANMSNTEFYDYLDEKRRVYSQLEYQNNQKFMIESKKKHEKALDLLSYIKNNDKEKISASLLNENQRDLFTINSKTLLALDATLSMSLLLNNCKNTIQTMFERAIQIIKDNGLNVNIEIQICAYRNYDCDEDNIIQVSPWDSDPYNLRIFLSGIEAKGGWREEAIEVALMHANNLIKKGDTLNQVIIIGDAAPNPEKDIEFKKKEKGLDYWNKSKVKDARYYEKELNDLKIPVHAFYVNDRAKDGFEIIANKTKGRCSRLDLDKENGVDILINLVTEEILRKVGQENGKGNSLVEDYQKKFSYI